MARKKPQTRHLRVWIEADTALKAETIARALRSVFVDGGFEVRGPVPLPRSKGDITSPVKEFCDAPDSVWGNMVLHSRLLVIRNATSAAVHLLQDYNLPSSINIRFGY